MATEPVSELHTDRAAPSTEAARPRTTAGERPGRFGATLQASRELLELSGRKLQVPVHDIRLRILSLVVFAALAPALLVGVASYSTAKRVLTEKLSDQLSAQAFSIEQRVDQFLQDRESDTKVFASAYVVAHNLSRWVAADQQGDIEGMALSRERLRQYLTEVQQRYPLYIDLQIIDPSGRLVTSTRRSLHPDSPQRSSDLLIVRRGAPILREGGGVVTYQVHPIIDPNYESLGNLVTVSKLDEVWVSILSETGDKPGRWWVLDTARRPLFHSGSEPIEPSRPLESEAIERALLGESDVGGYVNHDGLAVLGAFRFEPSHQLAYLVEMPQVEAFAASLWLRNFSLLVSLAAAGLVTAIAILMILSLTRPIDALIAGAKAVADGDLSQQISVSSKDQIGYLTQVFNRMTSSLLESRRKLEKMTRTDELTGLPNRRELDRMFATELGRAERSERPLSVLMLDLDNFKRFNDRYGHLKGDSLLSESSHFLQLNLRPTDIATRYGGEEFVILLPDTTKRQAAMLAERLREQFATAYRDADDTNPWVTISIGVATWPEDGQAKEDLIRSADTALYAAKRDGRNRVRTAVFPAPLFEQSTVDPGQIA